MNRLWAEIDSGKTHHHCLVLDQSGERLLSHRVVNDEPEYLKLLACVLALGDQVTWAVDMAGGDPPSYSPYSSTTGKRFSTFLAVWSTRPATATGARARPTQTTRSSSPTRLESAGTSRN